MIKIREILFRGKRKDNGEWVFGLYNNELYSDSHYIHSWYYGSYAELEKYEVVPETVGQYTGLTDKNGIKIFEGDIVKHYVQGELLVNTGVVNWDNENARWAYQLNAMNPCFYYYNANTFEVIGNIHDNPELLSGDKTV